MKVIIIGGSGHWHIVSDAISAGADIDAAAIAPYRPEEDMASALSAFKGARYYSDWREMADNEDADFAIVNPWFGHISEVSLYCLKKGLNVYSEKPLATTMEGYEALKEAAKTSSAALGGMFNYRFTPWFMGLESLVNEGLIGEVRTAHAQKSYRLGTRAPFYSQRATMGGLIPWVAIHAIDWVDAFMGKCLNVSARHSAMFNGGNGTMEISSAVLMGMENEGIATVTADFFRPTGSKRHDDDRIRLTGTRGMAEVRDGSLLFENEEKMREYPLPEAKNAFVEFAKAVNEGRAEEFTAPSLEATLVALKARESADNGGVLINVR